MVKSDGVICVPWDIKFKDTESAKQQNYKHSQPVLPQSSRRL